MRLVIFLIMVALVIALIRALRSPDKPSETRRLESKSENDDDLLEQSSVEDFLDEDDPRD
jgi:hypothetical protein